MDIELSWNLVLISTLALLFTYNFVLGQDRTVKLMLCIYIAILTADGVAAILKRFVFDMSPGFRLLFPDNPDEVLTWIRLGLFLIAVAIFVIKSGFHVMLRAHDHWLMRLGIHGVFALLSSILLLSTILIYIAGNSFVEGMLQATNIIIYQESYMARILIDYYQFWFSLPAIIFLIVSFVLPHEEN